MAAKSVLLSIAWVSLVCGVIAQPVTYDQRQEGKVNVQVDVKDLQIVAIVGSDVLDDFSYDYAYDYADFTIKPSPKPTTAKPSSTPKLTTAQPLISSESNSNAFDLLATKAPEEPIIKDSTTSSPTTKAPEEPIIKDSNIASSINSTVPIEIKIIESATNNVTKNDEVNSTTTESKELTASDQVSSTTISESKESTTSANIDADIQISSRRPMPVGHPEPRKRCPSGFQMKANGRCFKRRHFSPRQALMKLAPALLGKSQLFNKLTRTDSNSSS